MNHGTHIKTHTHHTLHSPVASSSPPLLLKTSGHRQPNLPLPSRHMWAVFVIRLRPPRPRTRSGGGRRGLGSPRPGRMAPGGTGGDRYSHCHDCHGHCPWPYCARSQRHGSDGRRERFFCVFYVFCVFYFFSGWELISDVLRRSWRAGVLHHGNGAPQRIYFRVRRREKREERRDGELDERRGEERSE